MPFTDSKDGQTNYCTHENNNDCGICDGCLLGGKYVLIDGKIPKWRNQDGILERYSHQDENFSNLCTSPYCRCNN